MAGDQQHSSDSTTLKINFKQVSADEAGAITVLAHLSRPRKPKVAQGQLEAFACLLHGERLKSNRTKEYVLETTAVLSRNLALAFKFVDVIDGKFAKSVIYPCKPEWQKAMGRTVIGSIEEIIGKEILGKDADIENFRKDKYSPAIPMLHIAKALKDWLGAQRVRLTPRGQDSDVAVLRELILHPNLWMEDVLGYSWQILAASRLHGGVRSTAAFIFSVHPIEDLQRMAITREPFKMRYRLATASQKSPPSEK